MNCGYHVNPYICHPSFFCHRRNFLQMLLKKVPQSGSLFVFVEKMFLLSPFYYQDVCMLNFAFLTFWCSLSFEFGFCFYHPFISFSF